MALPARAGLLVVALVATAFAGCINSESDAATAAGVDDLAGILDGVIPISVENLMNFTQSIVSPAIGTATDLYEPTMEVSDTGTIYVAGHVIGAATTGTPAYYSNDDGATWEPLPFFANLQTPPPGQGSQPPPGDEGFIVAGDDGQAWMADIYLAGFSISGWCNDGAELCYDNRQAYDRVATVTGCNPDISGTGLPLPTSLNDRPWAAYGNGKLLLVNNPGGGPMQIGVMDVPTTPVGIGGGVASVSGPTWNTCASDGGTIPGVPAMRQDGFFAVPQFTGSGDDQVLRVVIGNADDIFAVETKEVFKATNVGGGTSNGGRTAFDAKGTLFVGARNNTVGEVTEGETILGQPTQSTTPGDGRIKLAVSTDDGQTFQEAVFDVGSPVQSLYLDGNMHGEGALVSWSQWGETEGRADWYVAHVFVGADGKPELRHVTLAVDEGPPYSAHVMGAAAGPDGRAYFLNFEDIPDAAEYAGSTPISVWIQQDGPVLPQEIVVEAVEEIPEDESLLARFY